MFDIGLLHHFEKLARIGRQALDIAPLPLGIDGVKRKAGFARTRQSGDHDQGIARQVDIDPFEVVFPRAADGDFGERHETVRSANVHNCKGATGIGLPDYLACHCTWRWDDVITTPEAAKRFDQYCKPMCKLARKGSKKIVPERNIEARLLGNHADPFGDLGHFVFDHCAVAGGGIAGGFFGEVFSGFSVL